MKNKTTTLLLPLLCAILMACAGLFVACGNDDSSKGDGGTFVPDEPATYTLTFVTDGGTVIPSITEKEGSAITPPADPEKTGFEFDGWYLTPEHSGNAVTLPTKMPSENKTYYAKFLNKYVLEYNANAPAGTIVNGSTASTECVKDKPAVIAQNGFSITGYRFMGWSTSADGDVNVSAEFTLTQNTTVYAVWNKGYQNKTKQDDYLFVNGMEAVLLRNGTECKGTYDSATKTFSVTVGNETIEGRLFEDQTYSCYGENSFGIYLLYNAYTGEAVASAETLALFDNGIAKYNETVAGSYTYLSDGNFMFASANDSTEFIFKIATLEDETLAFYKQGSEEGVYYPFKQSNNYSLQVDGYGNAVLQTGTGSTSFENYSYVIGENGILNMTRKDSPTVKKNYKLSGGYYSEAKKASGEYTSESVQLSLDGYLIATYNGKEGLYIDKTIKGFSGKYILAEFEDESVVFELSDSDSNFIVLGKEIGSYQKYKTMGGYESWYIFLKGNGNAEIRESSSSSSNILALGTYHKKSDNENEWTFNPNSEYTNYDSFDFIFKEGRSNEIIIYNSDFAGTFTCGEDTLVLDGYATISSKAKFVYTQKDKAPITIACQLNSDKSVEINGNIFVLNTDNKTFSVIGGERLDSGYWFNNNKSSNVNRPSEDDKRMTLDGEGNAVISIYQYDYDTYEYAWSSYATGTYAALNDTEWQFVPDNAYVELQPTFKFVLSRYPNVCYIEDSELIAHYTAANGSALDFDAYTFVTYTDPKNVKYKGLYTKDNSYITLDTDDKTFVFKLSENTFSVKGNEAANYTLDGGSANLELDGEGHAILAVENGVTNGTYSPIENTENEFKFVSDELEFEFRISISDKKYFVAYEYANRYVSSNGFDNLLLENYGTAVYTDQMGATHSGNYVLLSEHIVELASDSTKYYFRINFNNGTFINEVSDFVSENEVLVAYQGTSTEIVMPDGITSIANKVFAKNATIVTVNLNEVQIIGEAVFQKCTSLQSVTGANVSVIGANAFNGCTKLENAEFGNKVAKIGTGAFTLIGSSQKQHELIIIIKGANVPEFEESAIDNRNANIALDSLEVISVWYKNENVSNLADILCIASEEYISARFYDLAEWETSIDFSNGIEKTLGFSVIDNNNNVTFYKYNATVENKYTTTSGTYLNGILTVNSKSYAKEGTAVTYTDAENNVLVVTVGRTFTATYNGEAVSKVNTSPASFVLGYTYTLGEYCATNVSNGTFAADKEFTKITTTYICSRQKLYIEQNEINSYNVVNGGTYGSTKSVISVGSTNTTLTANQCIVHKTVNGFIILDVNSSKIFELTITGEGNWQGVPYTATSASATATLKASSSDYPYAYAKLNCFNDSQGNTYIVLALSEKYSGTYNLVTTPYTQDGNTYTFSDIACGNKFDGNSYIITVTMENDIPKSFTIVKQ